MKLPEWARRNGYANSDGYGYSYANGYGYSYANGDGCGDGYSYANGDGYGDDYGCYSHGDGNGYGSSAEEPEILGELELFVIAIKGVRK